MITERGDTVHLCYDSAENILYFTFPGVVLETVAEIEAHFGRCVSFWKRHCEGRKVYCVVDYDGVDVNVKLTGAYAKHMKRILEFAIAVVCYGGSSLQRTVVRLASMKLRAPSRLYATRDEALQVVRAVKSGKMVAAPPSG
jgi:DNA-binding helix-hairpin-helix protein with protein kinase domain